MRSPIPGEPKLGSSRPVWAASSVNASVKGRVCRREHRRRSPAWVVTFAGRVAWRSRPWLAWLAWWSRCTPISRGCLDLTAAIRPPEGHHRAAQQRRHPHARAAGPGRGAAKCQRAGPGAGAWSVHERPAVGAARRRLRLSWASMSAAQDTPPNHGASPGGLPMRQSIASKHRSDCLGNRVVRLSLGVLP